MRKCNTLLEFSRLILNYVGNGYQEIQVSTVPEKKRQKITMIDAKITKKYQTDLTRGQRQYRKKKGICNYVALRYNYTILVLKTPGEIPKEIKKEEFGHILKTKIQFEFLGIEIVHDKEGYSFKLTKKYEKEVMNRFELAISKREQNFFKKEITKIYNLHRLLPYRVLNKQVSNILKKIKTLQKKHNTHYKVPEFFK